jgi:predicted  nucleic acid-binding Zn-ribbon protein
MKPIHGLSVTRELLDSIPSTSYFPYDIECPQCGTVFQKTRKLLLQGLWETEHPRFFCSKTCGDVFRTTAETIPCKQCGTPKKKKQAELKKTPNTFCSRSCAAIYNNAHKTHGTRRSKIELMLEERLRAEFPTLEMVCNQKSAINSELDFYFPSINLALEVNGIFHYEPIFGQDKLDSIQNNDNRKMQACLEHGIELVIIQTQPRTTKEYVDRIMQALEKVICKKILKE